MRQPETDKRRPLTVITILALVAIAFVLLYYGTDSYMDVGTRGQTSLSPLQIKQIRDIGQWEFLSLADEEIVDTTKTGIFSDSELTRIYHGTLRLGIDMSHADSTWISMKDDSVTVTLPPITLLDPDFVDEANSKPFFENGSWDYQERKLLYEKARKMMIERCFTPQNIALAESSAKEHFLRMMHAMGYEHVNVVVQPATMPQ